MNGVARVLRGASALDETLSAALLAAAEAVPAADHVSLLTIDSAGALTPAATTSEAAARADELQIEISEGPICEAVSNKLACWSDDLDADTRFRDYGPKAAEFGLRSQLSLYLPGSRRAVGVLNLYAAGAGTFDADAREIAMLLASRVAASMAFADTVEGMSVAMSHRTTIGQAIGIVMERYELDEDGAFQYLVRLSQTGNVKLRAVAAKLVESTKQQHQD